MGYNRENKLTGMGKTNSENQSGKQIDGYGENKFRKSIGKQIESRRKELGLTQGELAKMCGLVQTTVSKIELGRFSVSLDLLQRVCKPLKCHMELKPDD